MFDKLSTEVQNRIIAGDPKDPQTVKGIPRDIYDALAPDVQQSIVAGDDTPKSQEERYQKILLNSDAVNKFAAGNLGADEQNELVTKLQAYITPVPTPQGTSVAKPIPPNIQEALRQRQLAGLDTFGIDPALYGSNFDLKKLNEITQTIVDPDVDLQAGAGLLSDIFSVINYMTEQTVGEVTSGSGSLFAETRAAKDILKSIASVTRDFVLEGRQLALELNLTLNELPDGAFTKTDAQTLANIKKQRTQLDMFIDRSEKALANPSLLTSSSLSQVRLQLGFAKQLKAVYDAAYQNMTGEAPASSDPAATNQQIRQKYSSGFVE